MKSTQRVETRKRLGQALQAKGQRLTRQRAKVYEVLCVFDQHPTAEAVYHKVRQTVRKVSLATVYKSLEALVQCGLAQKLCYGDGAARYDSTAEPHPHLRDLDTGVVLDLPTDMADQLGLKLSSQTLAEIRRRTGYDVVGLRIELLGRFNGQPAAGTA